MYRYPLFLLLLTITYLAKAQEDNCQRTAHFGDISVCLPLVAGYTEGYLDPYVKPMADGTEAPINSVIGYYLNNETYNSREALGTFAFDDYFKVYGTKDLENVVVDQAMLAEMADVLNSNFIAKNWEELKGQVGHIAAAVEIGTPVVIDSYKYNDSSFTSVMLVKYQVDSEHSFLMSMSINGLQLKDRIVWMAYYLEYIDDETVSKLKAANDKILKRILESNS